MTDEDFNTALDKAIPPSAQPVERLVQFFNYNDPPWELKGDVGEAFESLARHLVKRLPHNPECAVALRKLLEARDCAMRAAVMK